MCVPSLNEIHESIFASLCTQVQTYGGGGGKMDMKPVHNRLSSGDKIIYIHLSLSILNIYTLTPNYKYLCAMKEE